MTKMRKPVSPERITSRNQRKVWWKCEKGHSWASVVSNVAKGSRCPYCANQKVWTGYNDIATTNPEILGNWDYDKNQELGYDVTKMSRGLNTYVWWRCASGHSFRKGISSYIKVPNCPICKNPYADYEAIRQHKIDALRENQAPIATRPELLTDWDYEKNSSEGIFPEIINISSKKKTWWRCEKGHSYRTATYHHTIENVGCPYCSSQKVLSGFNYLETLRPEVLTYWDYEKNDIEGFYPNRITANSGRRVWWKCDKGHSSRVAVCTYVPGSCRDCNKVRHRRVLNIDTNEQFETMADAARSCGLKVGDSIGYCCQGRQKIAGGYHWKYIDEE